MAYAKHKVDEEPKVLRRIKKEIVYEYIPVLGGLLGWWRKAEEDKIGETIEIHLQHSLEDYDHLYINGVEVELKKPS